MKITFILPCYPNKPIGGLRIVYEYANELVARGHEVTAIHPAYLVHSAYGNNMKAGSTLPPPPPVHWQKIDARVKMEYVPYLGEENIPDADSIIATAWYTADYVNQYSPAKGAKFYLIQSYEIWDGPEKLVNQTWHYPMNKIVVSRWLHKIGEKMGATDLKYIPNAIDHEKFRITTPIGKRPNKIAMLFSNNEIKGAMDGLKAILLAKKEIPELEVVCFGVPKRNRAIPKGIQYIRNPTQKQLVEEIYNGSSMYLCPSWIEGWGLPSSEAMACGCALISTKNGGVEDFAKHNHTALLSPIKNPKKLAEHIIRLAKDDVYRMQIAKNGIETIKQFNYKRSTDLLEEYLVTKSIRF
ncbi:glycosyltransferase family 4 protein [Bacillus sp. FJAT-49711]|uniref:glycosyltransferase family 4 protein n=1 Tax=Bacillus sp. FJAT-49711 TaxID=2833585 RepID=UPI001BCA12A3|nr:glycosyltransferase family 4 protein [Bacillus sp. FJAT-49711]MBS4216905.1 glycosyltransferase family 4 protein [Bacillus sp. FJAT-49711]